MANTGRNNFINIFFCVSRIIPWRVLRKEKPDLVISTGAAPGGLALYLAKRSGIKTVWIDSIANAEELSLSGQKAGAFADLWLTQWPELAREDGPHYKGSVL